MPQCLAAQGVALAGGGGGSAADPVQCQRPRALVLARGFARGPWLSRRALVGLEA